MAQRWKHTKRRKSWTNANKFKHKLCKQESWEQEDNIDSWFQCQHLSCPGRRRRRSRHLFDADDTIPETLQEEQVAELPTNGHDSLTRGQPAPLRRRSDYGSQVVYVGSSENPPQTSDARELFTCVCGALMANEEITTHMSEECPKRLTLCQYCRKQVGHAELQVSLSFNI